MQADWSAEATRVIHAADYLAVFGGAGASAEEQAREVKQTYRRLARLLHPDVHRNDGQLALAEASFARLGELQSQANEAIRQGFYGRAEPLVTITSRRAVHRLGGLMATGDLCDIYAAQSTGRDGIVQSTVCKVAGDEADNDLMVAEAVALKRLQTGAGSGEHRHYLPQLVDSFDYGGKGQPLRRSNVFVRLEGFYTLRQLEEAFPAGLNPLDMAWIWRRLLYVLDYVHQNGVVHGAVLPEHVMIHPAMHGVVLLDWCYASFKDDDTGLQPPIKAMVDGYRGWYPEAVAQRQNAHPSTDLILAASTMVSLLGGDPIMARMPAAVPDKMRKFFEDCLPPGRPADALLLLQEFDFLLERLGAPYYPRKFRPFTMPTGTV